MRRPSIFTILASIIAVALALASNMATNTVTVKEDWWPYAVWSAVGLLTIGMLLVDLRRQRATANLATAQPLRSEQIADAAGALRRASISYLSDEVRQRGLRDTPPMRIPVLAVSGRIAAGANSVFGRKNSVRNRQKALQSGDVTRLAELMERIPRKQFILLGPAESGKTTAALLLALGIAERRSVDDRPVPVLLQLASWDPFRDSLGDWLRDRLAEFVDDTQIVRDLMVRGLVLPVLDGFDELPIGSHVKAIRMISEEFGSTRPFVLTSRTKEFTDAVEAHGKPFPRALVAELGAVEREVAENYLTTAAPAGAGKWAQVLDRIEDARTPLSIYLVGVLARDPDVNWDQALGDKKSFRSSIFDTYLAEVYRDLEKAGKAGEPRWAGADRILNHRQWLQFIAHGMRKRGVAEISWWRLEEVMPSRLFRGILGISLMFLAATLVTAIYPEWWSISLAGAIGGAAGFEAGGNRPDVHGFHFAPKKFALSFWLNVKKSRRLALGSAFIGVVAGIIKGGTVGHVAVYSLLFSTVSLLFVGVVGGVIYGIEDSFVHAVTRDDLTDSSKSLRSDLRSLLFSSSFMLVLVVLAIYFSGWSWGLLCVFVLVLVVAAVSRGRGGRFLIVLLLFAWRRVPWHFLSFLDDAHHRGLLRRSGASYQFRHESLRDYLADSYAK
ncbi:hypothetical protein [Lentzea flaviverrucosa]|uniref:NACHT domain-containing protein n=1 Tax=Lentzea flaviverrucosa TaxID=200379 RepID=A0A1H9BB15_9PSEU|nr:hypothetical protein [Lentzea flaviverrucosa]RDI31845.1 hypothetical protein DFR72_103245 [Lentzea flaviverrucosa]SEP85448.1 hypothetical protein SAMN05216195_101412 [Lentzea flaviverrucosa]